MAYQVKLVNWQKDQAQVKQLRQKVYVFEWRIPEHLEFDQQDSLASHVLVHDDSDDTITPVATGRLTRDGEIGRIAVQRKFRCPDVYNALIDALVKEAKRQKLKKIKIQCQLDAIEEYQKAGFKPIGKVYMDAGIPRQKLECSLRRFSLNSVQHTH